MVRSRPALAYLTESPRVKAGTQLVPCYLVTVSLTHNQVQPNPIPVIVLYCDKSAG